VGHELGQGAPAAGGVRDPDRLGQPQVARGGALAQQREAVGREGHQAVERARELDVAQRRQQAARLRARRREVLRGEGPLRGPFGLGQARLVAIVADRVAVAHLAEVHRVVLVAQDRVHDLARLARELGQWRGVRELVLDRHQRHVEPRSQLRHAPAPDPRSDDDVLGADGAERRLDAGRAATLDDEAGDLAVAERGDRVMPAQRLRGPYGLGDPVVGHVQAAEDRLLVDEPQQPGDLRGVEQPRLEPEAARARPAAVELGPALLGGGDLDAAHRMEGVQRGQLLHRPLRQARHRARRVVLEHEPRRVGGRAAGLPQRALVDDDDLLPAPLGEVVGDARAGDPGADDDHAR
jgi:hypothetical protein